MKIGKFFALGAILFFTLLAVPSLNVAPTTEPVVSKRTPISVACVFATGGLGDQSFNDMAKAGLDKAQADGLCTFVYSEPDQISEYDGLLQNYASNGTYDLIVSIGFDQATAVNTTAIAYPSQKIVLIDMVVFQGSVRSVVFNAAEGSMLVGAMASLMTATGKVGFVGGMDIPLIREFWAGYKAGVIYENEKVQVVESFVGDWGDPATGKSKAQAMYADGADIIFVAAGSSGLGALEAASEAADRYAIGVDADQDHIYPGHILCSMMKRVDIGVYKAIEDVVNGAWTSTIVAYGLADNGVGISPLLHTRSLIGEANIQEVNVTLRNKIINGEITVPTNETLLEAWVSSMGYNTTVVTPGFGLILVFGGLAAIPILLRRRK